MMGLGRLLDVKAIAPEAFKPSSFEPSAGEVDDAKKIFSTFVLPELEILLGQKPANELLDASDVAIAKVYQFFLILLLYLVFCSHMCDSPGFAFIVGSVQASREIRSLCLERTRAN